MSSVWDAVYNPEPSELETKVTSYEARIAELEAENQQLRDEHFAAGEVREHNGSLTVIGALHPQIELDALPIGTKVYIKLALLQEQDK